MRILEFLVSSKQKSLWKKLKDDAVIPVVSSTVFKKRNEILEEIILKIKKKDYHPYHVLGFLGYCKNSGVTRFVPIMRAEDFAVYYACTAALQDKLCFEMEGVFGAWRMKANYERINSNENIGEYTFDSALSTKEWIKNYKNFTDLLIDRCENTERTTYFHVSDIANFYDNIDITILEKKLKQEIINWDDTVDILMHFLKYWNRGIRGYDPSSKGIPQEIVGDASRIIANFYLKQTDQKIKDLALDLGCEYIRWSDDIIFIGSDKKTLENIIHTYSMELHKIGLNLNASKTRCYNQKEIERYRCLDILKDLASKDIQKINRAIEWFKERIKECRQDTVIKRLLTLLNQVPDKFRENAFYHEWQSWPEQNIHKAWLKSYIISQDYEILSVLDSNQFIKLLSFYKSITDGIEEITEIIISKPYTAPKAQLLRTIKKLYQKKKITKDATIEYSVKIISSASNSELITKYSSTLFEDLI